MSYFPPGGGGTELPETFKVLEIVADAVADILSNSVSTELGRTEITGLLVDAPDMSLFANIAFLGDGLLSGVTVNNTDGIRLSFEYSIDDGVSWNESDAVLWSAGQIGLLSDEVTGTSISDDVVPTGNKIIFRLSAKLSVPSTGSNKIKRARVIFRAITLG